MALLNVGDTAKSPPRRVLVLEDDDSLLSLFLKVLQKAGYEARSAGTEAQAQSLIAQKSFDAIVIDLSVSGDQIFDFVASLRTRHPQIIIIIMSGFAPEEIKHRARQMNVDVIEKPFVPDELVHRVHALLAARAA